MITYRFVYSSWNTKRPWFVRKFVDDDDVGGITLPHYLHVASNLPNN